MCVCVCVGVCVSACLYALCAGPFAQELSLLLNRRALSDASVDSDNVENRKGQWSQAAC